MLTSLQGKILLIHHWDTDGICSARLLLEHIQGKKIDNHIPQLGNYFLTESELKKYSQYDFIIIADMAIPKDQILTLAEHAKIIVFDHHLQEEIKQITHLNPISKGEKPEKYPSASWIVNTYLQKPLNLHAILGIIGDHENEIKNNTTFNEIIETFCQQHNLTFNDLLQIVYLIDSNYKIGDKQAVEDAPTYLLKHSTPNDILTNTQWNKNLKQLTTEVDTQLCQPRQEKNNIITTTIHTTYNIISTITRKISWDSGKDTIVINTGFFPDYDQIYVRSKKNVQPLINKGKTLGFKTGGKQEVLGAIVPKEKTESFIQEIILFLTS